MSRHDPAMLLLPAPRRVEFRSGTCSVPPVAAASIDPAIAPPQGYQLNIKPWGITIIGADPAGVFYGRKTLAQLRRYFGEGLPCLQIDDWPDFPVRGVMLDISRDKVPKMSTLLELIDLLAGWKINQIQLYMEHTFTYRGHEEVWQNADALTAEEIHRLDKYCRERFVELVPNQNSFGHMERWLKHARYLPLAEVSQGAETPWGFRWEGPFSLCPTDPGAIELLRDLYGQLLPNFSSRLFNAGLDETFDIGQGRSLEICADRGVTAIYLDFLKQVQKLVAEHGRKMMFWGDIILNSPQLISQLPPDVIALNWGYEADHPFETQAKLFHDSGVPYYVCPGTSSWCSLAGRTDTMVANQQAAAEAGLAHGAIGYLNTDWGDYGHLQYLPISYAGFATGAAMSWCLASNRELPLAEALDLYAFADRGMVLGQIACAMGNLYQVISRPLTNRSAIFSILVPSSSPQRDPMERIVRHRLNAVETALNNAMNRMDEAQPDRPDADVILEEFYNTAAMIRHACRKGRWKLDANSESPRELIDDLEQIIETHRTCWLARNRAGGLEDSVKRLAESLAEYRAAVEAPAAGGH